MEEEETGEEEYGDDEGNEGEEIMEKLKIVRICQHMLLKLV